MVFAVTTPDIGTRGISAFIVEKGWKGFEFGDHYDKMGIRSSSTAELILSLIHISSTMKETKYAGTQTEKNLMAAFAGESEARNKYTYFASKAKKEG